jgi:MFS family permease
VKHDKQVERDASKTLFWLVVVVFFLGVAQSVNMAALSLYAVDFGLDDSQIAAVLGWASVGAIGTLAIGRQIDRVGRRRVLLLSIMGFSAGALACALAQGAISLVLALAFGGAFGGAAMAAILVIVAEELPTEMRASGQARIALVTQVGAGSALVLVALLADVPGGWRWAWVVVALPAVLLPVFVRKFSETASFARSSVTAASERGRVSELFELQYRRRTIGVLGGSFLMIGSVSLLVTYLLYYPETALGLEVGSVTVLVIVGGAIGLLGFLLGAAVSDRIGRRPTVLIFGAGTALSMISYYHVPVDASPSPTLLLGALYSVGSVCIGATMVASRTAMTELFPTRLRGTIQGMNMLGQAIAFMAAQFAMSVLSAEFGFVPAITALGCIGALGYPFFYLVVPETVGLDLDVAAMESD